jgi:hypothetical protein
MPDPRNTDEALFDAARAHVARLYGEGRRPVKLVLTLDTGEKLKMPVPVPFAPAPLARPAFIPTDAQQAILDALAGRALTTDALAAAADVDRRTVFRVLPELRERDLVRHTPRLGYWRPDLPPDREGA